MQTIGHAPGVVAQWAGEPPVRDQPHHTHAAGGGREQYGGAGVQNTGIMEIKSHPCSSADPRHIELSGRLIHARDSRQPTLSGIKVGACDEQLGLTSSRCGATLQDSKIEFCAGCITFAHCHVHLQPAENVGNLMWEQKVCSCKNWPSTCLEL